MARFADSPYISKDGRARKKSRAENSAYEFVSTALLVARATSAAVSYFYDTLLHEF